ncbi:Amidophosphoribosyltransferase [Streptomyces hirsutus]
MCGIVGYVGPQSALDVVTAGLKRLEYRGYDSAGVAVLADGGLATAKRVGKLVNLEKELAARPLPTGATAVGHTRWATHGGPTDANAHPHLDNAGRVAVVHNGIIENFAELRAELAERGHDLASETDTEVVAHLLAEEFSSCADLAEAMRLVCRRLLGAFTLVAVHADAPDVVVGARRNSPLVVGVGEGESFLASDVAAFIEHTRSAIELGQDQVVELRRDKVTVTGFDGAPADVRTYHIDWDASAAEKGGYASFMLKEIAEQPRSRRRHPARPHRRLRCPVPGRGADPPEGAARGRQGRHRRLRDGLPRRADRQVRHRALDADPLRGRDWRASSATAIRSSTSRPSSSPSPSPARPWTP